MSIDDEVPDNYGPGDITEVVSLSADLRAAIAEWNDRMQSTYVQEQPQDSGFSDPADERKFVADGRKLARRLKGEVGPHVRVEYSPLGDTAEVIEV